MLTNGLTYFTGELEPGLRALSLNTTITWIFHVEY